MNQETTPVLRAARSGMTIGISQLASYGISFLLGIAIAALFGAAGSTDAYFMASSTGEVLAKILLGGALTSVFLPIFVQFLAEQRPERAWAAFSALFTLAVVTFLVLGAAIEMFAEPLMAFLTPGFGAETRALTVTLFRIALPAYLAAFLADLATVPLHAHRRFGLPGFSRLVVPFLTLLLLLALAGRIGVLALALGTLAGTVVQVAVLQVALRRVGYRFRWRSPIGNPDVRHILRRTLPFALSILAAHGAGAAYRILVSQEPEGSLASLKFAEKIFQMTNTLFLGSIAQVAFPAFARAVTSGSPGDVLDRLRTSVRAVFFLGVPLTVGIVLLREPLVRVLYERGAFTAEATAATAVLVPLFVIGLLGNGISSLLGHLALALQETKRIVAVNVALQALASALFVLLTPRYGIAGLAFASGIGPFLLSALYAFALRERLPKIGGALLDPTLVRLLVAGAACGALVVVGQRLAQTVPAGLPQDIVGLVLGGGLGAAGYLGIAWFLRAPEVNILRALTRAALERVTRRA